METLVSYGVTYLITNNSTLATLAAAVYGLLLKSSTKRLSVRAVLLCQSPEYSLTKSDIDEFLSSSCGRDTCEWSCTCTSVDENYKGPAMKAVHVSLYSSHSFASHLIEHWQRICTIVMESG